jgi:sporulation related protein
MATPINALMAGEIWHLSIEDLFQPVQEAPRLGGDGPFVINLSVSTAPINLPTKPFTSSRLEAHVYQIQVTEDGRTRYRLRLGPFATEDEADAVLAEARDTYPGALTATAGASDLRVIASMQAKADSRHPVQKPTVNVVIDKSVSAKIAATPSAPEKTAPEKTASEKTAPAKAAIQDEISIDVAWPTPALVVPPSPPPHAARAPLPAAPAPAPAPAATQAPVPAASAPQWELPELDVPLPTVQKRPASAAPVVTEAAMAAPKAAAKVDAPLTLVDAPTLTEVVLPAKASKSAAKRAPMAAPVLTEVVRPKTKAPAARAAIPTATVPAVVQAPAAARATLSPTSPPAAASQPAAISRPVLPAMPLRTALTALVAQATQTAPPAAAAIAPATATAATPAAGTMSATVANLPAAPPPATASALQPPAAPAPKPAAAKSAAPIPAMKPAAPVDPQSIAHPPRKSAAARLRAFAQKATGSKLTSLQHVVVATAPVPAPREVKVLDEPLEDLESTQTLRALTPVELEDHAATRWFVIQLACADHAFDPDAVPNLDIFSEYRLYSVAGVEQGRVVHTLRLGFFREEIGAVAVASYLGAYWDKPTIKRVSVAERERFADQRVEARKDVGATGKHAVIEITDELVARRRRSAKMPAATKPAHRPI